jgi:hypothetical protein
MNQTYLTFINRVMLVFSLAAIIIIGFKSNNYTCKCEWSTLYQYDQRPLQLIIADAVTVFVKVFYILDHTD